MLMSKTAREEANTRYATTIPMVGREMLETTTKNFDDTITTMEAEVKAPWQERVKDRHRNHPFPWWTPDLAIKNKVEHQLSTNYISNRGGQRATIR